MNERLTIYLPVELKRRLDEATMDPVRRRPSYSQRGRLIAHLLEEYFSRLEKEKEA